MNVEASSASLLVATLVACVGWSQQEDSSLESLLMSACKIEFQSTGRIDEIRAWLDCGCGGVLLTHPMNLLKQVRIRTPAQALSFLRLFSSRETYRYFPIVERVEILPDTTDGPFVLESRKFFTIGASAKVEEEKDANGRPLFRITRTTVSLPTLAIEEVVELLHEDGYYRFVSSRVLAEDATKLGMILG